MTKTLGRNCAYKRKEHKEQDCGELCQCDCHKKSQCCNAEIKKDKGGIGIFSLTTGSLICQSCKKFCVIKN